MKNIQVIDRAANCAYSVFAVSDLSFKAIFPGPGQDIEFIEDFIRRVGKAEAKRILSPVWRNHLDKKVITGIHGTLFYESDMKKRFYPSKRETDLDEIPRARPHLKRSIKRP